MCVTSLDTVRSRSPSISTGICNPGENIAWVDRLDQKTSQQQNATPAQQETEEELGEMIQVIENYGGPGRSRTADQRFRKPLLYPTELRGHVENKVCY